MKSWETGNQKWKEYKRNFKKNEYSKKANTYLIRVSEEKKTDTLCQDFMLLN